MSGCGEGCGCGGKAAPRFEREHWRSLEQLADTPEARAFREREFPEGASELPEGIDRRSFVQLIGASLSLAGLTACRKPVEKIVPFVQPPEEVLPGIPKRYATTMASGSAAWGLLVESREGRPTKVEGNELHPATRGGTSAQMQAAILALYDPDRSQHVMEKSAGAPATPAGAGHGAEGGATPVAGPAGFEKKSWADFVNAWKAIDATLSATGGAGLAVLAGASSSPTRARLAALARGRFPQIRWATWDPVSDENAAAGIALAAGRPLRAAYELGAAKCIVSLDADLFQTESEAVAHARGFATGRALASESEEMNRLWAVESALTTTGAMADHRLALASGSIDAFTRALAGALAARGVASAVPPGAAPTGIPAGFLEALAADLAAHRGSSAIVAGRDQPPAVHAMALALNSALGNVGTTVALREPLDVAEASTAGLRDLVAAMASGAVTTLVVAGGNPAYDAPADFDFGGALAKVGTVIHLGAAFDETAAHAHWHLPEAHFLEAWGDARSADGTASVVQPLIEPLFGGKSAIELLRLVATGEEQPGYDAVRETWQALPQVAADAAGFDAAWNRALHDGLLAASAAPAAGVEGVQAPPPAAIAASAAEGGLEIVFRASPAAHDGRFANVGWLQELPDAISKLTWGNAALVAPETAKRLGLKNEDGVRVTVDGASVELPIWIVPGQAAECVVVHLGYGRSAAGRVGNGVGANVYPLRRSAALGFVAGAKLEPTGERHRLAQTQDHGTMEGRPIVREATLEEWREEPHFAAEMVEIPKTGPLWDPPAKYDKAPQWAMAVDLNVCTGCNACVIACQSENNVPIVGHEQVRRGREMHWLRIDRYYSGSPDSPEVCFQPMPCQQCENAPCEQVCPVAATVHSEDGLNAMVYNRCIGTRYCSNNCPYKVRRFNFFNYTKDTPEITKLAMNPNVTVRSRGVMEKCTYCVQRIQSAKIDAKMAERPLADGDVKTACQQACPTQAIVFGDQLDAASQVVERKKRSRNYELLAELGNRPRTSYLARIRNPHPDLARHAAAAAPSDPSGPSGPSEGHAG